MSSPVYFIDNRQYHKSNYDDILKYLIPSMYYEQDYSLKNEKIDILDQVINSHLKTIGNISSVVNVSAVKNTIYSSINSAQGISKFFVKQNLLTDIDLDEFERKILLPINRSFRDFNTSSDFSNFLKTTLLPGIILNSPTIDFVGNNSPSSNHNYLITNLSWLYFLNFSKTGLAYNPSSYVHDILVDKTYRAKTIQTNDGIRGLTEFVWRNYTTCTTWQALELIPTDLLPPGLIGTSQFTSGTQQLDKLLTLVDVLYSPLHIDNGDFKVKDAIDDYLQNSFYITTKKLQGPFLKLLKAFSFAFADHSDNIDRLEVLNQLDRCPDEYLPLLAELIGWRLFGAEPTRWRLQLANAVDIYKTVGTKKSIQFVIDSVFGQDVFKVSSTINECWESYVPFLLQYALATESTYLKNFDTWTFHRASELDVNGYSLSSMDENIRMCVDKIIYDTVYKFKNNFILGSKPFDLRSSSFIFNYRGRNYKVPPFEEIPYYTRVIVNEEMIVFLEDRLICFGVPKSFAEKVSAFIRRRTMSTDDDYSIRNSWLMFTSGVEYPPNWNSVIEDISNNKSEYLPLWNGKSSHFKVLLDVSNFNFAKTSLEADSREALSILSQSIEEFAPAKSVPNIIARGELSSDYDLSNVIFQYLNYDKTDYPQVNYSSGASLAGFGISAVYNQSYKRGITPTSVQTFSRQGVDSLIDPLSVPSSTATLLPRRNHRRRNYKFLLPKEGYYDKTGFNGPASLQAYLNGASEHSYFPLGLIPSSQTYVTIPDYNNIPQIYNKCENLNSRNSYYGVAVSDTFPARGWRGIESNAKVTQFGTRPDYYLDYGQLHPIVATIHYIKEMAKIYQASSYYCDKPEELSQNAWWKNILQSYANSSTELSGGFPNSFDDYINFDLGRDFHKLYYDYTHNFLRHRAIASVLNLDGPTLFGHAFGSIFMNSKLSFNGWVSDQTQLITSSLENLIEINSDKDLFSTNGITSGTYIANSISQIPVDSSEFRNSGVLKYIELTQVSGFSLRNSFSVLRIDKSNKANDRYNPLLHENTIIRQKAHNGLGKIIFNIGKYQTDSNLGFDVSYNFLSPEHKFKLSFDSLICSEDGKLFGGGAFGVWIHTKEENGQVWTYTPNKVWERHSASGITTESLLQTYAHLFSHNLRGRNLDPTVIRCTKFLTANNPLREPDVIASLSSSDFTTNELEFNTENIQISVPNDYFVNTAAQVHRLDQNYIIEIFTLPSQDSKSSLMYNFNLIDLTLNKWSKPLVGGIRNGSNMGDIYCKEFRVDLSREQVLTIIKYLNSINGAYSNFGYASRVAATTSSVYEASGGSRINYVESPDWYGPTKNAGNFITTISLRN